MSRFKDLLSDGIFGFPNFCRNIFFLNFWQSFCFFWQNLFFYVFDKTFVFLTNLLFMFLANLVLFGETCFSTFKKTFFWRIFFLCFWQTLFYLANFILAQTFFVWWEFIWWTLFGETSFGKLYLVNTSCGVDYASGIDLSNSWTERHTDRQTHTQSQLYYR